MVRHQRRALQSRRPAQFRSRRRARHLSRRERFALPAALLPRRLTRPRRPRSPALLLRQSPRSLRRSTLHLHLPPRRQYHRLQRRHARHPSQPHRLLRRHHHHFPDRFSAPQPAAHARHHERRPATQSRHGLRLGRLRPGHHRSLRFPPARHRRPARHRLMGHLQRRLALLQRHHRHRPVVHHAPRPSHPRIMVALRLQP